MEHNPGGATGNSADDDNALMRALVGLVGALSFLLASLSWFRRERHERQTYR